MSVARVVAMVLVLFWWLLLLGGTVVNTAPYREAVSPKAGLPYIVPLYRSLWYWFVTATCYTVSNVLLLTLISGMLGGISRVLRPPSSRRRGGPPPSLGNVVVAGALQGFFAYVLIIAGFLFAMGDAFMTTTQEQYLRLAGLASVFSFVLGYDPSTFGRMLGAVRSRFMSSPNNGNGTTPGDAVAKGPSSAPAEIRQDLPVDAEKPLAIDAAAVEGFNPRN